MIVQSLSVVFALVMGYFTYVNFRKGNFGKKDLTFWEIIWLGVIVLAFANPWLSAYSTLFGVIRLLDLVTALGFMLLFALVFFIYKRMNQINRNVEEIVKKISLKGAGRKK